MRYIEDRSMQPAMHGERASRLRHAIDARREWMGQVLAENGGSGTAACAGLSDTFDEVMIDLWRAVEEGIGPPGRDMCLVATGGWGRREVCPYSDIDLLLLAPAHAAEAARAAAERLL